MTHSAETQQLLDFIVDRVNVGIFVLNRNMEIVVWNNFMEMNSGVSSEQAIGGNLFELFPDLPKKWFERKIESVFILKNFAFTSWEQRPYLFKFQHNRPVTGGVDYMRQDCTLLPVKNASGEVEFVCVTLLDVTDTSIYQNMMKTALEQLSEASNRDGLTGIYNRRYLEQTLSKEFCRVKRYGGHLSFILMDLDHFKQVNDQRGHLAGDEVLKRAAEILNEGIREADTLGRYGGEEFAIVAPETRLEGVITLADRLRESIAAEPVMFNDEEIPITVSIGVAELTADVPRYEQLIDAADVALYHSKETGRNRVTPYDPQKFTLGSHIKHG